MAATMESDVMNPEQNPKRIFKIILRVLLLVMALAGVFVVSFLVTLSIKADNPREIVASMFATEAERRRKMLSDLEEERRIQRNLAELEREKAAEKKSTDAQSKEEPPVEEPTEEKSEPKSEPKPEDRKVEDTSWAKKIARLRSIKAAVNEQIAEREHYVPLEEIPRSLRQAIVAVEDTRFYSHKGFDPEGIARATVVNVEAGHIEEGGSTITQQLVKNLFLTHEQSFTRKVEEILLAINMERNFTKDEILELYLNTIYFGSNFYGIYEAAMGYFGKEPWELTLAESTMLAGLPQAPSLYSPYVDFMAAKNRQLIVIQAMVRANLLSDREAERARVDAIRLVADGDEDELYD